MKPTEHKIDKSRWPGGPWITRWPWVDGWLAVYGDWMMSHGHPATGPVGVRMPIQGWKMRAAAGFIVLDDDVRLRLHVEPTGRLFVPQPATHG